MIKKKTIDSHLFFWTPHLAANQNSIKFGRQPEFSKKLLALGHPIPGVHLDTVHQLTTLHHCKLSENGYINISKKVTKVSLPSSLSVSQRIALQKLPVSSSDVQPAATKNVPINQSSTKRINQSVLVESLAGLLAQLLLSYQLVQQLTLPKQRGAQFGSQIRAQLTLGNMNIQNQSISQYPFNQ